MAVAARRGWHPSESTRSEILDEAERQFRSRGYAATSVGDIARAIGMSPSNVFKYFGSKAGLLDSLVARHLAALEEQLAEAQKLPAAVGQLRAITRVLLDNLLEMSEEMPQLFEFLAVIAFEPPPSSLAFQHRLRARMSEVVRFGITRGEFAARDAGVAAEQVCDALSVAIDPVQVGRGLQMLSKQAITEKCESMIEFVIAALRMPIVK